MRAIIKRLQSPFLSPGLVPHHPGGSFALASIREQTEVDDAVFILKGKTQQFFRLKPQIQP